MEDLYWVPKILIVSIPIFQQTSHTLRVGIRTVVRSHSKGDSRARITLRLVWLQNIGSCHWTRVSIVTCDLLLSFPSFPFSYCPSHFPTFFFFIHTYGRHLARAGDATSNKVLLFPSRFLPRNQVGLRSPPFY